MYKEVACFNIQIILVKRIIQTIADSKRMPDSRVYRFKYHNLILLVLIEYSAPMCSFEIL
jgi:hypothetical protein